jgi:hypothetical protein
VKSAMRGGHGGFAMRAVLKNCLMRWHFLAAQ